MLFYYRKISHGNVHNTLTYSQIKVHLDLSCVNPCNIKFLEYSEKFCLSGNMRLDWNTLDTGDRSTFVPQAVI
jgi:hypothetical protein